MSHSNGLKSVRRPLAILISPDVMGFPTNDGKFVLYMILMLQMREVGLY